MKRATPKSRPLICLSPESDPQLLAVPRDLEEILDFLPSPGCRPFIDAEQFSQLPVACDRSSDIAQSFDDGMVAELDDLFRERLATLAFGRLWRFRQLKLNRERRLPVVGN